MTPPIGRQALGGALFVGGWLVLGALGRSTTALWFAGLAPVALWLAVAGATGAVAGARGPAGRLVAAGAMLLAGGLGAALQWGSGWGTCAAAVGWGVLSCAATRWTGGVGTSWCASSPLAPGDPANWPALAARWAMLPMMAALVLASDWCAGAGLAPAQGVALHLAAMGAPALLLQWRPARRLPDPAPWIAGLMVAGILALPLLPGVRGWMAMSSLHALAWGIAWSQAPGRARFAPSHAGERVGLVLCRPMGLLALGVTIDTCGPAGLVAVHVGLAALSLAGAAAGIAAAAGRHAPREREENFS